jgi:chaperonin GroES
VGSGALDADGNRVPIEVAPGDRVLISRYAGTEIKVDGASYLVLREGDILATVVEE